MKHPRVGAIWDPTDRYPLFLLAVLLLGGILQASVAVQEWASSSEGQYVQSALMIAHGDLLVNTQPMVPILLSPLVLLSGDGLFAGRALMITANLLTALILASLVRMWAPRYGKAAALATSGLYLADPFTVATLTSISSAPLANLLVSLSLFLLLRKSTRTSWKDSLLSGLILGGAVLCQWGLVALIPLWLGVAAWIPFGRTGRFRSTLALLAGAIILPGSYLLDLVRTTSLGSIEGAWSEVYLAFGPSNGGFVGHLGFVGYLLVVAGTLILSPLVVVTSTLRGKGWSVLAGLISIGGFTAVALMLVYYPSISSPELGEISTTELVPLLVLSGVLASAFLLQENLAAPVPRPLRWNWVLLIAVWVGTVLSIDLWIGNGSLPIYSGDALAPLSLFVGYWIASVIPELEHPELWDWMARPTQPWGHSIRRYGVPLAMLCLVISSSAASAIFVLGPSNSIELPGSATEIPGSSAVDPPIEVAAVAGYLRQVMAPGDSLFTFDVTYASAAGRIIDPAVGSVLLQYDHFLASGSATNLSSSSSVPSGEFPSIPQLLSDWNRTNLSWVIEGPDTLSIVRNYSLLGSYFSELYHPVRNFGDPMSHDLVILLHRGPAPDPLPTTLAQGPTDGPPVAGALYGRTAFSASLDSPNLTFLTEHGGSGQIPLKFPGARSLAVLQGDLWVGSTLTSQVEILYLSGHRSPEVLSVGSGPSAFAGDAARNEVFVATVTSGTVVALTLDPNGSWWHTRWTDPMGAGVTGLAVNASVHLLYAALPATNEVRVIDERTGRVLEHVILPFSPFTLTTVGGGLVVSSWLGEVGRLSLADPLQPLLVGKVNTPAEVPSIIPMPSLRALGVPSEQASTVTILNATTLYVMGTIPDILCPSFIIWDNLHALLTSGDSCHNTTHWWELPAPTAITLEGPPDTRVLIGSDGLALYNLPTRLSVFPGVFNVTCFATGNLPGVLESTIPMNSENIVFYVTPGPSEQAANSVRQTFTVWVIVLSLVALTGGFLLMTHGSQREWTSAISSKPSGWGERPSHPPKSLDKPRQR